MKKISRLTSALMMVLLFLSLSSISFGGVSPEITASEPTNLENIGPQLAFYLTRQGQFLSDPEKEANGVLKKIGKAISEVSDLSGKDLIAYAAFITTLDMDKTSSNPFVPIEKWTDSQKQRVNELMDSNKDILEKIATKVSIPQVGYYFKGIVDPIKLSKLIEDLIANPPQKLKIKPAQLSKIRDRLLPLLSIAKRAVLAGSFSEKGITFQLEFLTSEETQKLLEMLKTVGNFTFSKFIDSEALFSAAQIQNSLPPAEAMEQLSQIPQTEIVKNMLASSGLDLEKDILPTATQETVFSMNLSPKGEGGFPDARIIAKVATPSALLELLPKLKDFATKCGFFVSTEDYKGVLTARLSFFLLPTLRICVALEDNLLYIATGRDVLVSEIERVKNILSGKKDAFKIPEGVQRYYRFAIPLLNAQLQEILQSPLLANKGIPPIPNMDNAENFGVSTLQTRVVDQAVELIVEIPFK
ncbi:MAG: hypothetical protein HQM08_25745 [Candidatus Riflebacteria bacterium]|nr:hypothetical protein [Candidatus Riflebacteria bacterium]